MIDKMMKIKHDKKQDKYYSQIQYVIPTEKTVEFEGEELE
jgi:hypothetical protein